MNMVLMTLAMFTYLRNMDSIMYDIDNIHDIDEFNDNIGILLP